MLCNTVDTKVRSRKTAAAERLRNLIGDNALAHLLARDQKQAEA